ncbi:hypothetical protein HYG77_12450 [Rhodococcus sp. ZPP]|nr:hypothetical protein HYG77_12450 [Rhodococcus sp. ZPP]
MPAAGGPGHGSHGGASRMRAARCTARISLKELDFDFDYARGLERDTFTHREPSTS